MSTTTTLDIHQILKKIPHRYPILLIDRVLELDKGKRIRALKNVSINEPHFLGHFPHRPVMPGVLMLEAMAQAASFSAYPYVKANPEAYAQGVSVILIGIDGVRFRKPVVPGDTVIYDATLVKCRRAIWGLDVTASVDGQKVAEASLLATITPRA